MNEYFPTVVQVIPLDNFHVQVFFDDGKIVDYDATEDLKAEIFKPLREINAFKEACTVMNGTLAWDISGNRDESSCIDIDPFTVYELEAINNLIAWVVYSQLKMNSMKASQGVNLGGFC